MGYCWYCCWAADVTVNTDYWLGSLSQSSRIVQVSDGSWITQIYPDQISGTLYMTWETRRHLNRPSLLMFPATNSRPTARWTMGPLPCCTWAKAWWSRCAYQLIGKHAGKTHGVFHINGVYNSAMGGWIQHTLWLFNIAMAQMAHL